MRFNQVLLILWLAGIAGGALVVAACFQPSMAIRVSLAVGGFLISAGVLVWIRFMFDRAVRKASNLKTEDSSMGIKEIGEILQSSNQHWSSRLNEAESKSESETRELKEVKDFLSLIDRRKSSSSAIRDAMPTRERLERILSSYGTQLDSNMQQVLSCRKELQKSVEELVSGSETQSDLVGKTTNFVEEMSARVMAICDTADTALDASTEVRTNIETGLQQLESLVDEMKQVRNHVSVRERRLLTLGQHTREIEAIVETIGSLSSRTDLLALNASIESVRAGEHGRGFAIVAEEVRALAEQSAEAVQDISRRIEMIQLETEQSISVASGEHNQLTGVIDRVSDTLDSLQNMLEIASQSKAGLDEISNESTRQLKLTQDIVFTLEQSSETTQSNRSHAEGAHWTSKSLGEISERLNESLELFRRSNSQGQSQAPTV